MERTIEQVTQEFNVDREPFCDVGVSGLFFTGGGRLALLEQLLHLSRYGPALLVLMGVPGVGKSTLAKALVSQADPSVYSVLYFDADMLCDELQLIEAIIEGFRINVAHQPEPFVEALCRYTRECELYSQTPLLVVDNAQKMSAQAVQLLLNLVQRAGPLGMHMLMLLDAEQISDQSVLAPVLRLSDELRQSVVVPRLSRADSDAYIDYRMRTAGLAQVRFSARQLECIHQGANGVMDTINILARQTLTEHLPVGSKRRKRKRIPRLHVVAVGVVVVLLGMSLAVQWVWQRNAARVEVEVATELPPSAVDRLLQRRKPSGPPILSRHEPLAEEQTLLISLDSELDQAEPTASQTENADSPPTDPQSAAVEDLQWQDESVDYNFSDTPTRQQPSAADELPMSRVPGRTAASPAPALSADAEPAPSPSPEPTPVARVSATPQPAPTPQPQINREHSAQERWLLSLDPGHYTLQLLGVREEKAARDFVARYPGLQDIAYFKTLYKGKDWYVVVYGDFTSRQAAAAAVARLPDSLRSAQPWSRPLSQIQQEIKQ